MYIVWSDLDWFSGHCGATWHYCPWDICAPWGYLLGHWDIPVLWMNVPGLTTEILGQSNDFYLVPGLSTWVLE
jgi:hypothetical protein